MSQRLLNLLGGGVLLLLVGCQAMGGKAAWHGQYQLAWRHWADVRSMPFMTPGDLDALCDGNLATGAQGAPGPEIGSTIEFRFPTPVAVTEVRLVQQGADQLELAVADQPGGECSRLIARLDLAPRDGPEEQWLVVPVGRTIHGLRLLATDGQPGYRQDYPLYREIAIGTVTQVKVPAVAPEAAKAQLALGPDLPRPPLTRRQIEITPCIDLWHAGIVPGREVPPDYAASPGFQELLRKLRDIDASGVRLFLETYCCQGRMPWHSKICPAEATKSEALREVINALHANALKGYIFLHAWIPPIQKEGQLAPMPYCRWDYPYEQSDFIFTKGLEDKYKVRYPCVISDNDFRDKWQGILSEVVDLGIDGVYVLPDEYYYKGHYLPKTNCPNCQRRFQERYGYAAMPTRVTNTTEYRKWRTFEYERLAEMFNEVAGGLKAKKADLELLCCPNLYAPSNTRMEHGIALDRFGAQPNFTGVMVYCGDPKRAEGAFPDRVRFGSVQCLGTGGASDFPIIFEDYFFDLVMNGCTKVNMYRLNYMEGYWPTVITTSKLVRLLEAWDLGQSRSAAETCVLMSRASEDWWQLAADTQILDFVNTRDSNLLYMDPRDLAVVWSKTRDRVKADDRIRRCQYERFRGMYSTQYVEQMLKRNGVQYDIRYSELPATLSNLDRYKLIILPFNYSMSKETFAAVEAAVVKGTKLLIYQQLAPTDQYGDPYPAPLLQALVGKPGVTYADADLMGEWSSEAAQARNLKQIRELLASDHYFNPNGASVRYWARRVADGSFLLYLGNLERTRRAEAVLGLPLPAGKYAVTVATTAGGACQPEGFAVRQARLGNQTVLTPEQLKHFGVSLQPGEVMLVRVQPAAP